MPRDRTTTTQLRRGGACTQCRQRKIKCDGSKPACAQCLRSPRTCDSCRYPADGANRTQQLEATIDDLHTRIRELEARSNEAESCIFLQQPYQESPDPSIAIPLLVDMWPIASTDSGSPQSYVDTPRSTSPGGSLEDPPLYIMETLVDAFLLNFEQVGFFLDTTAFRQSALLANPVYDERPLPSLLNAVCMWGCRLSKGPHSDPWNQKTFLTQCLASIPTDLNATHPHGLTQMIQAEILLSLYYLTLGRSTEGHYHSSTAVSLAIGSGLHRIGSSDQCNGPYFRTLDASFPPASDEFALMERINAFWTVLIVNNYWVAITGTPSMLSVEIDTPWPLDLEDVPPSAFPGGQTLRRFLNGYNLEGFSVHSLHAKASVLLERAIDFSTRSPDMDVFRSLDQLLDELCLNLPHVGGRALWSRRSPLVTQTLVHVAVIRLHAQFVHISNASRSKSIAAAKSVVAIIRTSNMVEWNHLDSVLGVLWATAAQVFVSQLATMHEHGSAQKHNDDILSCLNTILSAMTMCSDRSPLIGCFLAGVQEDFRTAVS
ncbi:hypothetical protein C8J57DRAFT_668854 [Mycena rebaudengoi]|nr:hypothetical protein C8J57DRAFT_668854 [Mycena rebaudengoi]